MTDRVTTITYNLPVVRDRPIGRDVDAAALREFLLNPTKPLVTLTGPGGIGKTTLGLYVASEMLAAFAGGVHFIDLTHVTDSALILDHIMQIMNVDQEPGRSPAELLAEYFGSRHALLFLDNFEHLLDGALFVTDLLQACPNLNILATSREPLRLQVEQAYPLSPLALPEANKTVDPKTLAHIAAVDLFVRRARAVRPDFELTTGNAADVAAIVVQLDGIPLAIQLAAARIRLFSPAALRARLQESPLGLLTGGARDLPARQQTIRTAIRWSNDLLMPPEARFFRRLGVFAGGFDLAAAKAVTAVPFADSDIDALSGVESLLDKSLILRLPGEGGPRFGLLETVRAFALEQLAQVSEDDVARRAHFDHYLALAEAAMPHLRGEEQPTWLARLAADEDNLRVALNWALKESAREPQQAVPLLRLAGALGDFWMFAGHHLEGQRWLEQAIVYTSATSSGQNDSEAEPSILVVEARVWSAAGTMAWLQSNFTRAVDCHRLALDAYTAAGDETMAAQARHDLVINTFALGRWEEAITLNSKNIDYFRKTADWHRLANALNSQALFLQSQGDLRGAMNVFDEALNFAQRCTSSEQSWLPAGILSNMGQTELLLGNLKRAEVLLEQSLVDFDDFSPWAVDTLLALARLREAQGRLLESRQLAVESLTLATENNFRDYVADGLEQLAFFWSEWGDAARAAHLLGAAAALRKRFGAPDVRDQIAYYNAHLPRVRAALSEEQFAAEWAAGKLLSRDQAVELAMEEPPPAVDVQQEGAGGAADPLAELTPREREVALLMARGKTNQQIADELFITIKTVEKHAGNALGKLGFRSRVELAAWTVANGLLDN